MRLYDKVVNLVDLNIDAGHLTIVFLNSRLTATFDLNKDSLYW